METHSHNLKHLMQQLGLPADPTGMNAFFASHTLPANQALCDAAFWSAAQAQFLREAMRDDADWSAAADALALRLS